MRRSNLLAAPLLVVLPTFPYPAEPPRAEGTLSSGDATVEVLSQKLPVGERIDLPEGWYRIEEEGTEDEHVGSFTVAEASGGGGAATRAVAPPPPAEPSSPAPPSQPPVAFRPPSTPAGWASLSLLRTGSCRAERSAYLRQLFHEAGIDDVKDPEALLRGLDGGPGGLASVSFWQSFEPFRNLSWSIHLKARARDLERCVRAQDDG